MPLDSSSLSPRSNDGYLQQQGSIDWVQLGSSTVSITVEFLVRLSNGGVEALTVYAAEAILSRLRLGPNGEIRVQEAIAHLKAFSSFNKALWFGFGATHVVRKLAESSEGLNCIAVCAALSEAYSVQDTAKILRELLVLCDAPSRLTPSLQQWMSLTEMCAGALASTDFGVVVHDVSRLCLSDGVPSLRLRSQPAAIARALNSVAMVSNGSLDRVQLIGGADCGWIAAFSVWLLDLLVEVRNVAGQTLYSSLPESDHPRDPQILIIYGNSTAELQLTGRSFVIPSGELLVRKDLKQEATMGNVLSYGRVPWETILQDTFGKPMKSLLGAGLATSCGTALGCAARIFMAVVTDEPDLPERIYPVYRSGWAHINSSSYGRGFVNTVRQHLPELFKLESLMDAMESSLNSAFTDAVGRYEQAIQLIAAACGCSNCTRDSSVDRPALPSEQRFCQPVLLEVITELVQIISSLSAVKEVLPARSGIEDIYWKRLWLNNKKESYVYNALLEGRSLNPFVTTKQLFTGRSGASVFQGHCAKASAGLCFVADVLFNLSANQDQCNRIHVIPGRIEWEENIFDEITDFPRESIRVGGPEYEANIGPPASSISCLSLKDTTSPDISCELLVEENGGRPTKSLDVAYRISTSQGRFLVGPCEIASEIAMAINSKDCNGRECGILPSFDVIPIEGEGLLVSRGNLPDLASIPLVRVLAHNVPAQWVALSQSNILKAPAQDGGTAAWTPMVENILQDRQCLYCLLMGAVRGPRTKHSMLSTRNVCIVTSL